jgi:hypothetical protein
MADWSDPTPFQLEALHEALLHAFPSHLDLDNLLTFKLGRSYAQVAPVNVEYFSALTAILKQARAAGWLDELVRKAMKYRPNNPKLRTLERSAGLAPAEVPAALHVTLEEIVRQAMGTQDLLPWLARLEAVGRGTCRIEHPVNTARGTGWLVGRDLLLTNWHVVHQALPGGPWDARDFVCRFGYAVTPQGVLPGTEERLATAWCVDSSPPSPAELGTGAGGATADTLDFALLRLARPVAGQGAGADEPRPWLPLLPPQPLPKARDIVFVVQHPQGLPIKLAVGDVAGAGALRLQHTANTEPGSSGSVVLDAQLRPVALHHAGDLLYAAGGIGKPEKNQAVPLGPIAARLQAAGHLQ